MLWDKVKQLSSIAKIYLDAMDEAPERIPEAYVVLVDQSYDESVVSGDGLSLIRRSTYNIRIHAKKRKKTWDIAKAYRAVLLAEGIPFQQFEMVYDPGSSFYSILLTGSWIYGT